MVLFIIIISVLLLLFGALFLPAFVWWPWLQLQGRLLPPLSFALVTSQLVQTLPLARTLVAASTPAHHVLVYGTMGLTFLLTPATVMDAYAGLVTSVGPLLGALSAVLWVDECKRASRILSKEIQKAEADGDEGTMLKVHACSGGTLRVCGS